MAYRILHCGKSIKNYNLCIKHEVVGFNNRGPSIGDTIFLAVKIDKKRTVCGLRAILSETTDYRPWEDAEKYVSCFMLDKIEYATPFDLSFLSKFGGKYWSLKYFQGAKEIREYEAVNALNAEFKRHVQAEPNLFEYGQDSDSEPSSSSDHEFSDYEVSELDSEDNNLSKEETEEIIQVFPDIQVNIMGTFQTVKFRNETDFFKGLEPLVNKNFYHLFPAYSEARTILIPENRIFISSGVEARGDKLVGGIKSIPDALLILFQKKQNPPLQINLIEYECYGENKTRTSEKSNYMNGQIIPQLMKFASSFSIVTDKQIRNETITKWVDKIINYVFSNDELQQKFSEWVKELEPLVSDKLIAYKMNSLLVNAFKSSIRVILIIDELSQEQRDTITNVIKAFRMENGESIAFTAYVVRLEQKINIVDESAEYALSVQS